MEGGREEGREGGPLLGGGGGGYEVVILARDTSVNGGNRGKRVVYMYPSTAKS